MPYVTVVGLPEGWVVIKDARNENHALIRIDSDVLRQHAIAHFDHKPTLTECEEMITKEETKVRD